MVYYFEARDGHLIYVGKNKHENEDLIKYGLPIDLWFHADDFSSAHVYLRLHEGESLDNISQEALEDCLQLTKQGSIDGSKEDKINIIITPWSNLKKTPGMDEGAVGYHNEKLKRLIKDVEKDKVLLNRITKTKREEFPDLMKLRDEYFLTQSKQQQQQFKEQQKIQKQQQILQKQQEEIKNYKGFFENNNYKTNKEMAEDQDDDFM